MTQRDPTTRRGLRAVSSGGDHYADWQSVYEDNAVWIYRTIYARVGNKPDAEDLTAEVFLAALRPLRLTVTKAEVRAYLRTTARTVLAAHWRETLGREITSIPDTQDIADQPPRPMSPSAPPGTCQSSLGCPAGKLSSNSGTALPAMLFDQGVSREDWYHRRQRQGAAASGIAPGRPDQRPGRVMNPRGLRRYVDDLLRGADPSPFAPMILRRHRSVPRSSCAPVDPVTTHPARSSSPS